MPLEGALRRGLTFGVRLAQLESENTPFVDLCRECGIVPKTGYKWQKRFLQWGKSGLGDQFRRPRTSPEALTEDVVCMIVRLKENHPHWSPRKIRELFVRRRGEKTTPSESSFKRVLTKAGLVEKRRTRRSAETGRLQQHVVPAAPNDVWTVDFKGCWYTVEQERREPFTVRDAYRRYLLSATILPDSRSDTVRACCERLFVPYGLPRSIRSDNGSPFAAAAPLRLSRLSAWWLALGIDLDRIDPGCPYQNGGHERMHRDLATELERRPPGAGW